MDHVLPIPTPDWNNPQPYDGPTDEEIAAFRALQAAADGLRAWVTGTYINGTSPEKWAALSQSLTGLAGMCTETGANLKRTVTGEVQEP
jgi:hypothetical protein